MTLCFFVSDLHGRFSRFERLFELIKRDKPSGLFIGGDIFPHLMNIKGKDDKAIDFLNDFFLKNLRDLKNRMGEDYPEVFLILGNDDGKFREEEIVENSDKGLYHYVHSRKINFKGYDIYGYSYIPPTPFRLKDWEKYDISRYVDPGCTAPEDGWHSKEAEYSQGNYSTIAEDLKLLAQDEDLSKSVFLFHSPPYNTNLDRAALDGVMIDHVPVDPHIGSIAIRKFIETRQPYLTLHGHCHESSRLTGFWRERIGVTESFSAAIEPPVLAVVRFELEDLSGAFRGMEDCLG